MRRARYFLALAGASPTKVLSRYGPTQPATRIPAAHNRRNEVLLKASRVSGDGSDVAVGLDDFQDAMEGVIKRE